MDRQEKVELLKSMMQGKKPEKHVFIVHTDDGLIVDTDNRKSLKPGEEENYIKQIQKENPMHDVIYHDITVEMYKEIVDKIQQEIA